jgi:hypothetical protein
MSTMKIRFDHELLILAHSSHIHLIMTSQSRVKRREREKKAIVFDDVVELIFDVLHILLARAQRKI